MGKNDRPVQSQPNPAATPNLTGITGAVSPEVDRMRRTQLTTPATPPSVPQTGQPRFSGKNPTGTTSSAVGPTTAASRTTLAPGGGFGGPNFADMMRQKFSGKNPVQ